MQIVGRTWLNLVTSTCGMKWKSSWPIFYGPVILSYILKTIWCMYIILWEYESDDPTFDPKINVGHCDLYSMVQLFCLISCRLFDVCTSYFGSMNQYDQMFDLKINVGHCDLYSMVQWFCLISWRLIWCMNIIIWDYESVWPKVWPDVWPQNKCRSMWPIFHGPVTLSYLYLQDYSMHECHIFR